MNLVVLSVTLVAEILSIASVALSIAFPHRRVWPPPWRRAWEGYMMWLFFIVSAVGIIAAGIVDWRSINLVPWIRWGVGVPLWIGGSGFAQWAMITLGAATSFGDEGGLIRRGPYRYSRNPQYVGFIVGLMGWAIVSSSAMTLVASLVGVIPLVLVPFAEEPWLEARYGEEYKEYKRAVPRFIVRLS